jgi:lysyl-tRNA synthetase class 2
VLRTLHLPTSPEFHLKRLLAAGWTRPFEIKDCFRNGESGPSHQPEFAMLEWYRAFETLDAIEIDIGDLLAECARALGAPEPPRPRVTTVRALFEQAHGFELRPETSAEDLRTLAFQLGLSPDPSDAWDDLFFRVFLHRIEPELGVDGPLIVRDYPPRLAALARLRPNGWADRLEVYWRGLELANGFHELNDPLENEARFAADAEVRLRLGRAPFPRDEALLEALRGGMPPAAGIALGLDRLFMALLGIGDIREARPFPI